MQFRTEKTYLALWFSQCHKIDADRRGRRLETQVHCLATGTVPNDPQCCARSSNADDFEYLPRLRHDFTEGEQHKPQSQGKKQCERWNNYPYAKRESKEVCR